MLDKQGCINTSQILNSYRISTAATVELRVQNFTFILIMALSFPLYEVYIHVQSNVNSDLT